MVELRIIPDHETAVDEIFLALSECASLHPDPDSMMMDEDGEQDESADAGGMGHGGWYTADNVGELSEIGQVQLEEFVGRNVKRMIG